MILGIGTDLVAIGAFREQLADPASSFANSTFTPAERRAADSRPSHDPALHLAARFAAKEAFIKAWSGANYGGEAALRHVDLREIEVANDRHGRPSLCLTGAVARAVSAAYPTYRIHLSMSHDGPLATAFVILERD